MVIPRSGSISANIANVYEDYEGSVDSSIIAATGIGTSLYTIVGEALSAYFDKTIVPTEGDQVTLQQIAPYLGLTVPETEPTEVGLYYRDASYAGNTIFLVVDSEGQVLDFNGKGLLRTNEGLYQLLSSFPPTTETWGKNEQGVFTEGVKTFNGVDYTFAAAENNKYTITPELGEWQ